MSGSGGGSRGACCWWWQALVILLATCWHLAEGAIPGFTDDGRERKEGSDGIHFL